MQDFENIYWLTNEKYQSMEPWERALHWASLYAIRGVKEVGHNAGLFVERFLKSVGLNAGYAWCAAFVYHCCRKAGYDPKLLPNRWKAAAVRNWVEWAHKTGRIVKKPKRGDLMFWMNANQTGHIEFVRNTSKWPQEIDTIGGNTDADGSREGDGVYYKTRDLAKVHMHWESGFIRIK